MGHPRGGALGDPAVRGRSAALRGAGLEHWPSRRRRPSNAEDFVKEHPRAPPSAGGGRRPELHRRRPSVGARRLGFGLRIACVFERRRRAFIFLALAACYRPFSDGRTQAEVAMGGQPTHFRQAPASTKSSTYGEDRSNICGYGSATHASCTTLASSPASESMIARKVPTRAAHRSTLSRRRAPTAWLSARYRGPRRSAANISTNCVVIRDHVVGRSLFETEGR